MQAVPPAPEASSEPPSLPPGRAALRRLVTLAPWLSVAAAVLAFHHRVLPPGLAFGTEDLREYFIPVRALLQHILRDGDWPFWQRSIYLGFPLWASSEAALFLPTTWLFLPLEAARGLTLGALTHLVAAALGMFTWLRYRGRGLGASAVGALVVSLGGFTTVHLDHWTFSATLAPLPWTLLAVDLALRKGLSPGRFLGAALGLAGLWFGGAGQLAYYASLLAGGYVLVRVLGTRGRAWRLLLILPAGMLLAAPVLLAGAELSAQGPRAGGITLAWAGEYHWPNLRALALLLFPNAWGRPPSYGGPFNYWEMTGYVGLPVLALLLTTRPRGVGWYFLAVLLLSLVVSLGLETPVYGLLFQYLPGFNLFRVATRALFLANFAAAFLAAEALDRLAEQRRCPSLGVTAGGALVLLGVALWVAQRAGPLGYHAAALRTNLPWTVGLLAAFAVWVVASRPLRRWPALFPVGVALLLFVDLQHAYGDYMEVRRTSELARLLPQAPLLPVDGGRMAHLGFTPNLFAGSGAEGVNGYSQLLVGRVFDLFYLGRDGRFTHTSLTPANHEYAKQGIVPYSPLFPLFGASLLVTSSPVGAPGLVPLGREGPFWRYGLTTLPLAFWSQRHEVMDGATFRERAAGFNPFETVALEPTEHPVPPSAADFAPRPATLLARSTNDTRVQVDAPAAGLLVVLDPWYPGWRAEVDGQSAPVLRADYAFMAVPVPAGTHKVTLRYVPTTLWPGLACVLVVLGGTGLWAWRRRRPSGSSH